MSDLIVIGYLDEHRAHEVWAELVKLQHDGLFWGTLTGLLFMFPLAPLASRRIMIRTAVAPGLYPPARTVL